MEMEKSFHDEVQQIFETPIPTKKNDSLDGKSVLAVKNDISRIKSWIANEVLKYWLHAHSSFLRFSVRLCQLSWVEGPYRATDRIYH